MYFLTPVSKKNLDKVHKETCVVLSSGQIIARTLSLNDIDRFEKLPESMIEAGTSDQKYDLKAFDAAGRSFVCMVKIIHVQPDDVRVACCWTDILKDSKKISQNKAVRYSLKLSKGLLIFVSLKPDEPESENLESNLLNALCKEIGNGIVGGQVELSPGYEYLKAHSKELLGSGGWHKWAREFCGYILLGSDIRSKVNSKQDMSELHSVLLGEKEEYLGSAIPSFLL